MAARNPDTPKAWHHAARPIIGVIAAQGAAMALSLGTGLWVVRSLPPGQYALYTIATSVLGSMVLLCDAGIVAGAMALGGQCWREPAELGAVVNTARELRRRRAWRVALVALPVLAALLHQRGAGGWQIVLWTVAVAAAFVAGLGQLVWEIPLRLHEVLRVTQRVAIVQAAGRAALTGLALAFCPIGVLALLATGLAQAWASWRIAREGAKLVDGPADGGRREGDGGRRTEDGGRNDGTTERRNDGTTERRKDGTAEDGARSSELATSGQKPVASSSELRASILAVVRRALPAAVYGVLTQQFGLFFLSLAGTTMAVAQFGALSRIAVVLGVLISVNQIVFAPRFARIENKSELPRAYARYLGFILVLCLPLNLAAWWMPEILLKLVGSSYAGIVPELRLAVLAATLQAAGGSGFALGYARGWHMPPLVGIASMIAVQAACVVWLDLGVLHGVLVMAVAIGLHQVIVNVGYCAYRMSAPARS
ncbi:MAG: hypothetical protein WC661_16915 [Opitutaceae bacterium]|jgi:hypothetical protein